MEFQILFHYEIHITVNAKENIDKFRQACNTLNVKPLLLDLQSKTGNLLMNDLMTSSTYFGHDDGVLGEVERIVSGLKRDGYKVLRYKVETVPWHPKAPQDNTQHMPNGCYFESHIAAQGNISDKPVLHDICKQYNCHLSKNTFKRKDNDDVIMVTYRDTSNLENFTQYNQTLAEAITATGKFVLDKLITEFALFDSNVNHDSIWLTEKDTND